MANSPPREAFSSWRSYIQLFGIVKIFLLVASNKLKDSIVVKEKVSTCGQEKGIHGHTGLS